MRNIIKQSLIGFLILLVFTASFVSAEDKRDSPKWSKVGELPNSRSIADYSWCGDSSIVYFHITYQKYDDFRGGIMLYDIKTKKSRWISEDSNTGVGFCDADGSIVYWYSNNGLMAYEVKTGRSWPTGVDVTKFNASICPSSTKNTILVVGVDRVQLASLLSSKLKDWRILIQEGDQCDPAKPCSIQNGVARDGNYYFNRKKDSDTGKWKLFIYDMHGKLHRYIDDLPDSLWKREELIISGGYYVIDKVNHLIKRVDIKTGGSTEYPVREGARGLDINSNGELIYWIQQKRGHNIWFSNKIGDTPFLLEYEGSIPRFSPSGKYLYFHQMGVVILEKK